MSHRSAEIRGAGAPFQDPTPPDSFVLQDQPRWMCSPSSGAATATCDVPPPHRRKTHVLSMRELLYEKKAGIAYVTINRPHAMNALSHTALHELRSVMEDSREDPAIRGVIITGAGDKAFVTGADIPEIASTSTIDTQAFSRCGRLVFDLIECLGKPVIAAVNGFASGEGCELAMACTLRLATAHARFGRPEAKFGFVRGFGGTQRLLRLVGKGRALQLILTADTIDATEAHRHGLVNEIVDTSQLISRAEMILSRLGLNIPIAPAPAPLAGTHDQGLCDPC